MPSNQLSTPVRSLSMMSSLRALTFAMSTLIGPVATPYSAPRRARCAACALATRVLVGMHPVLTQVPPISLRSTTATRLPGCRQSTRQRWAGLPGPNDDRVETLCHRLSRQRARIAKPPKIATASSSKRYRQVLPAIGGHQPLAGLVAAQGAEHRADNTGAQCAECVVPRGADDRAGECAHDDPGGERSVARYGPASWEVCR